MPVTKSWPESGEQDLKRQRLSAGREPNPRERRYSGVRKGAAGEDLETLLSSVILASDKELGDVSREIDHMVAVLRRRGADGLWEKSHPVVWSALKQVLVEREIRNLALTDDLTCLYNQRGFFAAATQQLKVAHRTMQSMLLFLCDIDNLAGINDAFGRREGDLALVRTADVLEQTLRDSDVLARLEDDEFAILALGTSDYHEDSITRRLKMVLDESNQTEQRYQIVLNIGRARFDPHHPVHLSALLIQADRAMHPGKRVRAPSRQPTRVRDQDA